MMRKKGDKHLCDIQKRQKRCLSLFLPVFLAFMVSGCAPLLIGAAATAAGGYVWVRGNLELTVNDSAVDLYDASRRALDELNIMVERDRHDRFGANLSARTREGRKVLIRIDGQTEYSSQIRVRVGVTGDRHEAQILMNQILNRGQRPIFPKI